MIDSALTVRFAAGVSLCLSTSFHHNRSLDGATRVRATFASSETWNRCRRLNKDSCSLVRRKSSVSKIRATIEHLDSSSDPKKRNEGSRYHPSEDITESKTGASGEEARLTPAESTRTVIEVNSKATVMFTSLMNGEVHENVIWPDLPYVTDEHGNIYFQVKNDEDVLQTLTSDDNFVQVIIGYDTTEMIKEMESSGSSEIDFELEEIDDEDSDDDDEEGEDDVDDDDYDGEWVTVLEDGGDDDEDYDDDDDETLGDWAKLETMRSSHPMYFAKKLSEVASDDPIDWMQHPPAGLAIQGLLRPAFIQEHSDIQKHLSANKSPETETETDKCEKAPDEKLEDHEVINGHKHEELGLSLNNKDDSSVTPELEKDEIPTNNGASFYKLEMMRIQLITAHGQESDVEVDDVRKAQADAIAHSAAKIISRLKDGGEKTIQAFKSLCWRCKGIQVEEACIIGVDSFGFDLRACSGTQILTLRFSFNTRATSEYSAERQLNDLLFPRIHKSQKQTQAHQNEC